MSGTSMDGLDASVIQSDGNTEYSIILDRYFEYGPNIRQNLINFQSLQHPHKHILFFICLSSYILYRIIATCRIALKSYIPTMYSFLRIKTQRTSLLAKGFSS